MELLKISEVSLHKLTETHPVMSAEQFEALKSDIEINGQLQPVLVYRGKIVDGRHRYKALTLLGEETIKVNRLSNNITLDEVAKLVNSTELRRHQSPTQLAIKGYRLYKQGTLSQKEITGRCGCSLANLKHVVSLESIGRLDVIELLEAGGKMNVSRDPRYNKMTDSLLAITSFLKEEIARLDALQVTEESEDAPESKSKMSQAEFLQIQAVELLTKSWNDSMKKMMIAKLYESMKSEA